MADMAQMARMAEMRNNVVVSGPSDMAVYISFKNATNRCLNLYWIDYNGREVFYYNLEPHKSIRVNTFRNHPWIFRDRRTGQSMHVNNQKIYWPQQLLMRTAEEPRQWRPIRKEVIIHFPLRSLRDNCLWFNASFLKSTHPKPEKALMEIDDLPTPKTLKSDLKLLYALISNHVQNNGQYH